MSAKHTPGPWLEFDPGHIRDQSLQLVAVVQYGKSAKADARLIAAAPELLEALRVARDCILLDRAALADTHMNPVTNTVDDDDGIEGLAQYDAALSVIDAAIAKATGAAS